MCGDGSTYFSCVWQVASHSFFQCTLYFTWRNSIYLLIRMMPFGLFVIPCWILNSNLSDFFFQNTLKSSFHPFPPIFNVAVEISAVNVIVFLLTAFRTFLSVWWSSVSLLCIYGRVFKTATQDSEGLCNLHTVLVILVNERNTSINLFEHHLFPLLLSLPPCFHPRVIP